MKDVSPLVHRSIEYHLTTQNERIAEGVYKRLQDTLEKVKRATRPSPFHGFPKQGEINYIFARTGYANLTNQQRDALWAALRLCSAARDRDDGFIHSATAAIAGLEKAFALELLSFLGAAQGPVKGPDSTC